MQHRRHEASNESTEVKAAGLGNGHYTFGTTKQGNLLLYGPRAARCFSCCLLRDHTGPLIRPSISIAFRPAFRVPKKVDGFVAPTYLISAMVAPMYNKGTRIPVTGNAEAVPSPRTSPSASSCALCKAVSPPETFSTAPIFAPSLSSSSPSSSLAFVRS